MKFISLFAGIGGFDLGLERAGMECVAQVEIDPFCQKVLAKHWPSVERFSDVRECGKHNLPAADLICGGFPCQPHSLAGKRRGAKDDRDLWPEYRRIIAECRPRWVIGENVPGIRTTILDQVLSDLDDLGYTTGGIVIPACAFDAPHRRERLFIVAYAGCTERRPSESARNERNRDNAEWNEAASWIESPGEDGGKRLVADPNSTGFDGKGLSIQPWKSQQASIDIGGESKNVSNSESGRWNGRAGEQWPGWGGESENRDWWAVEPQVGRVAHGIPGRVDRLKSLGNAVVPQAVEWIGRNIMAVEMTTPHPPPVGVPDAPARTHAEPHARRNE